MSQFTELLFATTSPQQIQGIYCRPTGTPPSERVVLMLNAGLIHRVGMGRLAVKLARQLASQGLASVRIDLPGIGDSPESPQRVSHLAASKHEVSRVIDQLQVDYQHSKVVLWGICDGADAGFVSAIEDPRVVGLMQVDPFLYRTKGWYLRHIARRLTSQSFWINRFRRAAQVEDGKGADYRNSFEANLPAREMLSKLQVEAGYDRIISNGGQILVFVTGGCVYTYNYADQFYDLFPSLRRSPQVQLYYLPEADHVLSELVSQALVIRRVAGWLLKDN